MDVLNADTNHRLSRTLERVADRPLASPLIIRHVAGSPAPDDRKSKEQAISSGLGMDSTSDGNRQHDGSANIKDGQDYELKLKDRNEETETDGQKDEHKVSHLVAGCNSEISQGRTTNVADRALRMAPFTQASHGVSLMASEIAGGGGTGDSDEEAGDGNLLPAGAAAALSKSPLGSSSSAQLSGHRSVQHMLKQIQDAGERINERISSRDFGARRRLPVVPADAVNDSEMPTSSQSAKSDGSGEHRPIRSVLEELPRPAIRSPKSLLKNSGSPSPVSRQLPNRSAIRHLARNDCQTEPQNLELFDCPADDAKGIKCNRRLFDCSATRHSMLDDHLPNPSMSVHDADVAAEEMQPKRPLDCEADAVCGQLSDTATKPSVLIYNQVTPVEPNYVHDILAYSADRKLGNSKTLCNLAESEVPAESKVLPNPLAALHCIPVDNQVTPMQSVHGFEVLAYSVDLLASESCPENLNSPCDIAALSKLLGRGMADGESARNTVNDEAVRENVIGECLLSPINKLSDLGSVSVCEHYTAIPCCLCPVFTTDSNAVKFTSAKCLPTESCTQKIEALSKCASDHMHPEYLSSSVAAENRTDLVAGDGLKHDPKVDAEYVYEDCLVELGRSRSQASATFSDELLCSENRKGDEHRNFAVNCDQLIAVSVPNTTSSLTIDADTASDARPMHLSLTLQSNSDTMTAQHDSLFVSNSDKHTHNKVMEENTEDRQTLGNGVAAATTAKTSDKLKSADNRLYVEADKNVNLCHKTCETSALTANSELAENIKSSECTVTNANRHNCGLKLDNPFCLAGPKRALCSLNSSAVVSSSSTVIKTGGQPLTALSTAAKLAGNVPVKNDRLTGANTPCIRSACTTQTTTVSSAADKHVAVNQWKPGSTALPRATSLPPQVRLFTCSPQPPTEPASRPAVTATQARFAYQQLLF